MYNQLNKRIFINGLLLLLGSATAWAGRGDIDPGYGVGGRLEAGGLLLSLPDDRLIVADSAGGRLHLRRFDANGRIDRTFGSGGELFMSLPPISPLPSDFRLGYAAAAPDGSLLFEGLMEERSDSCPHLAVEIVLSVDRDGHLVGRYQRPLNWYSDDGRVCMLSGPPPLAAITLDSVGRILLVERRQNDAWDDWECGAPLSITRLMPSGEPDASFDTDGATTVPDLNCSDMVLFGARDDGSIVIGNRDAIVRLDASGAPDPTFGAGGRVSLGLPAEMLRGRLLPDGGVLLVGSGSSSTAANIVLTKFDRKGQLDSAFGGGTGSVQLDLGEIFFDVAGSRQSVSEVVLVPDARHLYLRASILNADGTPLCAGGIARLSIDSTPDLSFGQRGLTCLDYGSFPFTLSAVQRNGAPLFGMGDGNYFRLLVDETASPGVVVLKSPWPSEVGESDGTVTIRAVRTAGHDGPGSAVFRWGGPLLSCGPEDAGCTEYGASMLSDFVMTEQRIEWADGEEGDREVSVRIVDDAVHEDGEPFSIAMFDLQDGALAVGTNRFNITIVDDDPVTATGSSGGSGGSTGSAGSGGGGSLSWVTLLALLGLLRVRRRFLAQSV